MRELLVLPSQLLVLLVLRLQPLHQRGALRAQLLRSLLFLAPPPVGRLALNLELSRHLLRAQLLHVHFVELLLQLEPLHQWKRHGTALVRLLCVQQEFVRAARHAITPATARSNLHSLSDCSPSCGTSRRTRYLATNGVLFISLFRMSFINSRRPLTQGNSSELLSPD